jgi:hypothetical protein
MRTKKEVIINIGPNHDDGDDVLIVTIDVESDANE